VKLPIRNRHHARQNESDWTRAQAEHYRDATKEFQDPDRYPSGTKAEGLVGHAAKPPKQNQTGNLQNQKAGYNSQ